MSLTTWGQRGIGQNGGSKFASAEQVGKRGSTFGRPAPRRAAGFVHSAPSPPTPLPRSGGEGRREPPHPQPLSPKAGARGEQDWLPVLIQCNRPPRPTVAVLDLDRR